MGKTAKPYLTLDRDFTPRINARLVEREGYDYKILFDLDRPVWAAVNPGSEEFIELADGRLRISEIAARIAKDYRVEPEEVEKDALAFYNDLAQAVFFQPLPEGDRTSEVRSLFFHLTDRCNLACRHCYIASSPKKQSTLDPELVKRWIDDLAASGGRQVTFSGGEPLVLDWFGDVIKHVNGRLTVRLLTNGILINDEIAELLAGQDSRIQISLDGSTAEIHDHVRGKGSFDAAIEAIRTLQRHGLNDRINISSVMQEGNIGDIKSIADLAVKLGVPFFRVLPLRWMGHAKKSFKSEEELPGLADHIALYNWAIYEAPETHPGLEISPGIAGLVLDLSELDDPDLWCPLGRSLTFMPNGDLYPCSFFTHEDYLLGNAATSSLLEMGRSRRRAELVDFTRKRKKLIAVCNDCTFRQFCQAGCQGIAYLQHGSFDEPDEFCEYRKEMYGRLLFELIDKRDRLLAIGRFEGA